MTVYVKSHGRLSVSITNISRLSDFAIKKIDMAHDGNLRFVMSHRLQCLTIYQIEAISGNTKYPSLLIVAEVTKFFLLYKYEGFSIILFYKKITVAVSSHNLVTVFYQRVQPDIKIACRISFRKLATMKISVLERVKIQTSCTGYIHPAVYR